MSEIAAKKKVLSNESYSLHTRIMFFLKGCYACVRFRSIGLDGVKKKTKGWTRKVERLRWSPHTSYPIGKRKKKRNAQGQKFHIIQGHVCVLGCIMSRTSYRHSVKSRYWLHLRDRWKNGIWIIHRRSGWQIRIVFRRCRRHHFWRLFDLLSPKSQNYTHKTARSREAHRITIVRLAIRNW